MYFLSYSPKSYPNHTSPHYTRIYSFSDIVFGFISKVVGDNNNDLVYEVWLCMGKSDISNNVSVGGVLIGDSDMDESGMSNVLIWFEFVELGGVTFMGVSGVTFMGLVWSVNREEGSIMDLVCVIVGGWGGGYVCRFYPFII